MLRAKCKRDTVWKLINDENYNQLNKIRYDGENSNASNINMRPTDFEPIFEEIAIKTAVEFYDYFLNPFFDLLFEPTSQSLFSYGRRILTNRDELKLFWRTEMALKLWLPKNKSYAKFWPHLKKIMNMELTTLRRFQEIRMCIRSYGEDADISKLGLNNNRNIIIYTKNPKFPIINTLI